jgi:tRNA (guanine26-N2/guanine27-N2)-dimethyltransferase
MTLMLPRFPTKEVVEGKARILVPTLENSKEPLERLRAKAPVFYNPVQVTNRDTAVLAVNALSQRIDHPLKVCEPMCGSGVRGVRLALEHNEVESVVMSDLSPSAIQLAMINACRNSISDKIKLRLLDANLLLSLHGYPGGRFDYVDVDPYGSPVTFIESAIRATKKNGLLALTATDMAPLCGVNPSACLRKYGARPLHSEFCHETALRILCASTIRHAAVYETVANPVFSYYADHYIRAYFTLEHGARRVDENLRKMGYIKYCPRCLHRFTSSDGEKEECEVCREVLKVGGPVWLGELSEPEFTAQMIEASTETGLDKSRAVEILNLVKNEAGFPVSFYSIDRLCSLAGVKSIPTEEFHKRVKEAGHRVTQTHFEERTIKSDATACELKKILEN